MVEGRLDYRCDDCPEHSGIRVRTEAHATILTALDTRMNTLNTKMDSVVTHINDRFFQILIGIVLCLMTGIISIFISVYATQNSSPQYHSPSIAPFTSEYAVCVTEFSCLTNLEEL